MPALFTCISETEPEKLNYERYAYPCPMVQKRIFAVYLKAKLNWCNTVISQATGLHPNTVAHWLSEYLQKGFEGLLTNHYGTNKSGMENQSESILASFLLHPPHSSAEAADRITEMTGIKRSPQQVRVFMKRHGMKCLTCGHMPAKADNAKQHQWAETTLAPAIEAAQKGELHLFFSDAAHFVLAPFICRLWCTIRVFIQAAAGRNRINVLGAVHAITREVTTLTNTTYITAETLIAFLKLLKEKYADNPIAIVLDNARYQHCDAVKAMAISLKIQLLFLPPYSPNLNIIERLWKFTRKKVLYARYYKDPAAFHSAIESFFKNINANFKADLQNLLSLKFQFFDHYNSLLYPV